MTARAEVTRPVAYQQPSRWHRIIASEHLAGWAFVAPAVILIAVFALIPIGWSLLLSFQANNLLAPGHYVGFANYKALTRTRSSDRRSVTQSSTRRCSCPSR
jgi:multiple sugar transport system permease protein